MSFTSIPNLPKLATLALFLSAGTFPSSAQDAPTPAAPARSAVPEVVAPVPVNSPEALATAARNILELVDAHRFRVRRIDAALDYYRSIGDMDKVRQLALLRERELNDYQKTLETYRRMLGDQDFSRVAGLLRNHLNDDERIDPDEERDPSRVRARRDAAALSEESAADRAERVRRLMAARAEEARERDAERVAQERSQLIARARASQRVQLAQRLQQARIDQIQARDAAARRFQPPTPPSADSRYGNTRGDGRTQPGGRQGYRPQRP